MSIKSGEAHTSYRTALGKAAHVSGWFKRQDWARRWAMIVTPTLDTAAMRSTDLFRRLQTLREWIDRAVD